MRFGQVSLPKRIKRSESETPNSHTQTLDMLDFVFNSTHQLVDRTRSIVS